jgi:hypothetical protein
MQTVTTISLCSRGRSLCVGRCRRLRQASRCRVDATAQSFPKRGRIKVRGGSLQIAIFIVRVAPKTDERRAASPRL